MERLIEKSYNYLGKCYKKKPTVSNNEIFNKLGKYEDIEEELGIDLITLFKALESCWFYDFTTHKILGDIRPTLIFESGCFNLKSNLTDLPILYPLKQYGKTWALTREELL